MSVHAGLKTYGGPAVTAMINEFTQLNDGVVPGKYVVGLVDLNSLTNVEKKEALPAVNLIKRYRMGY